MELGKDVNVRNFCGDAMSLGSSVSTLQVQ